MIGRRNFFGLMTRGAVAAVCGAVGFRSARAADAAPTAMNPAKYVDRIHVDFPLPMTVEQATEILNWHQWRDSVWSQHPEFAPYADKVFSTGPAGTGEKFAWYYYLEPFVAIAVAEKLERDRLTAACDPLVKLASVRISC